MLELRRVDLERTPTALDFVGIFLLDALNRDGGEQDYASVCNRIMDGYLTLWMILDTVSHALVGAATTCAYQYPLKRTLHIEQFCCDSPREDWLPLIETFKEVAKLRGCADIEITGRRGWTKVLPVSFPWP